MRSRGANGIGYYNCGNYKDAKLDELAAASSVEADPVRREQPIKAALREHADKALDIPLH